MTQPTAPQLRPAPQPMAAAQVMPTPMPMPAPMPAPVPQVGAQIAPQIVASAPQAAPAMPQPGLPPMPAPVAPQAVQPAPAAAPLGQAGVPAMPQPGLVPETNVSALPLDEPPHEGGEKALPAVTIHAFCDRQDTAGVINEATRDWRMKRTNMKIFMGGLAAAIEFYHKEATPALIMIESGMRGPELFSQLETLASVCDENTKVVVIGAANDIRLYRSLMEKGVSDYLVPPFHPIGLIRSLGALYDDPDKPFVGRVVAFFGAKGGVGSSTIAHNVAWQLSETIQHDTALVDLDTSWGTTGLDFHYDHNSGLEEALAEPDRLDETLLDRIMVRHTPRLSILPASGNLGRGVNDKEAFEAVVDAVRAVSPLTLLDMPHMWTEWTESVLTAADDIVITAGLDIANLRNVKNLIDFLKAQRPNDPDPILILNKVGLSEGITVEAFAAAVGLEPSVTFDFSPDVFVRASNDGEMITDVKTAGGTVEGFTRIASRLKTGQFPTAPMGKAASRGLRKARDKDESGSAPKGEGTESKSFIKKLLKKG